MIEPGVADKWAQSLLIQRKRLSRCFMLLRGPDGCVEHDGCPAHHAAAQHVEEVFQPWCGPLRYIAFKHRRWQDVTCIIESPSVRKGIVSIRDGEVVPVCSGTKIHHAPAVVAYLEQQPRVLTTQLVMDTVIRSDCMVTDVRGVGPQREVKAAVMTLAQSALPRWRMRVVIFRATLNYHIAILFYH